MTLEVRWWQRWWAHAAMLVVLFFGAIAPTLPWLQFSAGMENINVATAADTVRDGNWLLPTLNGELRTKKPPLCSWITAVGILSSSSLEWGARWPSLLAACLTLVAVYALGRVIEDWRLGLAASLICGTSLLLLRYSHQAIYDVHLMLWVAVAHVFLALLLFRGWWWRGCAGAGAAIGMAMMAKGPIALLQTLAPVAAFVIWRAWMHRGDHVPPAALHGRQSTLRILAPLLGVIVMLAVALPWPVYVSTQVPSLLREWVTETTVGVEAGYEKRSQPYDYLLNFPMYLFPWTVFFAAGAVSFIRGRGNRDRRMWLMFWMIVVPILVMTCFAVRRNRYLMPMFGPAAIIAARGLLDCIRWRREGSVHGRRLVIVHWIIFAVMALGLAIAGASVLKQTTGQPWFTPMLTGVACAVFTVVILAGLWLQRRWDWSLLATGVIVMLLWQALFTWGYAKSEDGASWRPLAQRIASAYPNAIIYNCHASKDAPFDFTIYLNKPIYRLRPNHIERYFRVSDSPQVFLLNDRANARWLPAGAKEFDGETRGDDYWLAYILQGKSE